MRRRLLALTAVLASLWLFGCGSQSRDKPSIETSGKRALCKAKVQPSCAARDDASRSPAAETKAEAAPAVRSRPAHKPARFSEPPTERSGIEAGAVHDEALPVEPSPARERPGRFTPPPDRRIQSGTLTAGSFDDHEHFEDFRSFLSEAMQGDAGEVLPRVATGQRVMIHIASGGGRPIGDARVVVRTGEDSTALVDVRTGSDGRALFLPGTDGPPAVAYRVSVYPPDSAQPVTRTMRAGQSPWRIALPQATPRLPRRLDLALVVDTTGSMGDELEYLKVEIDSIAAAVEQMFPGVDSRYALVVYRDKGDQYVTRTFDFTGSLEEFRRTLSGQRATGGGDYPEAVHLALEHAGRLQWRDRDTARVLFLVGDAPPHDRDAAEALSAVEVLRGRGVRVFPVAASGVKTKAEFVFRSAAFLTLGQYLFLTDHSGVGNPHARPHVPSYQVERLDRLMIRMIASELSGKRLLAREVIAIEGGASPRDLPIEPGQQQQATAPPAGPAAARASFWLPSWVLLAGAIVLLCLVDAAVDRAESR